MKKRKNREKGERKEREARRKGKHMGKEVREGDKGRKRWRNGTEVKKKRTEKLMKGKTKSRENIFFNSYIIPTDCLYCLDAFFLEPNGKTWTAQNTWKRYSGQKRTLREREKPDGEE